MKNLIRIATGMLLLLILASCSKDGKKPEFVLTYSVFYSSTHVHSRLAEEWAKEINQRSDGRIRVDVYPGGVLSSAQENFTSVLNGVSDLGMSCFAYTRGMFPMIEGVDLPWGYRNGRQATRVANEFISKFQPQELSEVAFMYAHAHGPGLLASRKEVPGPETLKGMTIRGTGLSAQMVKLLGANPVGMSQGETYEALRKGVVDGTLCPIETLEGWKQGEVIEYITEISAMAYTTANFVVMNKSTWQKLPPELQEIITAVNAQWWDKHGQAWDQADDSGRAFVTGMGKNFSAFTPEQNAQVTQALAPLFQEWADKLSAAGLPGEEALAALKELTRGDGAGQ
ncbi:MAG: TRAP transporter substrate-binding protein [Oligosphaeraceae bacterium]|nr:TRAP transporter substrate-binding protein [Oligosphaeraceae bacterium]